ncbi:MAG: hypothetical protein AAGK02_02660 [Pseudomonadota bacterium]
MSSLTNLNARIDRLERTGDAERTSFGATVWEVFDPSPDGPVSGGVCAISVHSGEFFRREDYSSEAAFFEAASACHERVHGEPLRIDEGSAA